ncbi:MAG: hypothetical protein AB4050_08455 [Synechococcus sp.]
MFQSRDPRHSASEPDTEYTYLEDMDMYNDGLGEGNQWFPWVAALGLGGACVGIGLAFSWLMSPVSPTASRERNTEPIEIAQIEGDRSGPESVINGSSSGRTELEGAGLNSPEVRASTPSDGRETGGEESGPLGIPLTEMPLIPVDPSATSRVRSSHITADLDAYDRARDESSRPSRESEILSRDGAIAVNPNVRQSDLWDSPISSPEVSTSRQFFPEDSATEDSFSERHLDRHNSDRNTRDRNTSDREIVESSNVAEARTTSPRLDLGPSFGEGSYLVLMAYQGDNSLSQARKYSRGAFIKQLDGETYVQLAAFDQLEYARHMADNLRNQGVSVLILQ